LGEARRTVEELEGVVGDLEKEYNDRKSEREEFAKFLRDNNLEVEEYDPTTGPPGEPEESITSQVMRLGTLKFYEGDAQQPTSTWEFKADGDFVSQDANLNG